MRKRERENPCGICGHYHKYEEGEVCGECGHRLKPGEGEGAPAEHESAFPTEVLKDFLYLGSYSQASRSEVLKTLGISHILNVRIDLLILFSSISEECERNKSRVLVHCMSGKNRSVAFVAAFLMKSKGWRLAQCFQWVKDRRPQVQLSEASQHELLEYEQKLFGPGAQYMVPTESFASLGFGFPRPADDIQAPAFNQTPSIFERVNPNNVPANFTFGAEKTMGVNPQENNTKGAVNPTSTDNLMDSS
ncbi:hypothetical protein PR202_ga02540 [Eleusine coracana subsp. coracana]|uniref:Tyrosine specific protein phosphatases domain-containing protein n=1 Tax=Eleusine coracana subsp. coracana TaxID=191504 RepID=A0AAV5BLW4_ELECO|nr:hypothetical protein PR202_ga02540 [Eleusine coracana subsp. coracana]